MRNTFVHGTIAVFVAGWVFVMCPPAKGDEQSRCTAARVAAEPVFVMRQHTHHVHAAVFLGARDRIASAGKDGVIRIWDARTGGMHHVIDLEGKTTRALKFVPKLDLREPKLNVVASSGDDGVNIWDVRTGRHIRTITRSYGADLAISSDGRLLAVACGCVVEVWDLRTDELLFMIGRRNHFGCDSVSAVDFADKDTKLVVGHWSGSVRVFDVETGQREQEYEGSGGHGESIFAIAVAPDGQLVAAGRQDGVVKLLDLGHKKFIRTLSPNRTVSALAFSPDGCMLAVGANEGIYFWDVATGDLVGQLEKHSKRVFALSYSSDGRYFASAGADNTVIIWTFAGNK